MSISLAKAMFQENRRWRRRRVRRSRSRAGRCYGMIYVRGWKEDGFVDFLLGLESPGQRDCLSVELVYHDTYSFCTLLDQLSTCD